MACVNLRLRSLYLDELPSLTVHEYQLMYDDLNQALKLPKPATQTVHFLRNVVDVGKNGIPNDPTASDLVRFRNLNAFIRGFPQLRDLEVTIIQPLREKFSLLFRKWIINSFSRELRVLPQLKRYNFKIGSTTTYGSKTPLLTCLEDVLTYTRRDTQWILTNYM